MDAVSAFNSESWVSLVTRRKTESRVLFDGVSDHCCTPRTEKLQLYRLHRMRKATKLPA